MSSDVKADVEEPQSPVDTDTEFYAEDGTCVLVKWPVSDYPDPENSVTHGKTSEQILAWVGNDDLRASIVFREESDKFDQADVDLLWACQSVIDAANAPKES